MASLAGKHGEGLCLDLELGGAAKVDQGALDAGAVHACPPSREFFTSARWKYCQAEEEDSICCLGISFLNLSSLDLLSNRYLVEREKSILFAIYGAAIILRVNSQLRHPGKTVTLKSAMVP